MKTAQQLIEEAKARIREVTVAEVMEMRRRGEPFVLVDIRDPNEAMMGMIPGSIHLSRGRLEQHVEAAVPREARVVLYCASGNRSALAAVSLEEMGYRDVASMAGGIRDWVAAGGEVE